MGYVIESENEAERLSFQNKTKAYDYRDELENLSVPHGNLILDVGCGNGEITEHLSRKFPESYIKGVDFSEDRVDVCKGRSGQNLSFQAGSVYALPFKNESVDLYHSRFLFQHLSDPLIALMEAGRVLRSGGTFRITDSYELFFGLRTTDKAFNADLELMASKISCNTNIGRELISLADSAGFSDLEAQVSFHNFNSRHARELETENNRQRLSQLDLVSVFGSEFQARSFSEKYLKHCSDLSNKYSFEKWIVTGVKED
jgi:ubiquinone/menaquinone biosynthesis C-methylase UbiE